MFTTARERRKWSCSITTCLMWWKCLNVQHKKGLHGLSWEDGSNQKSSRLGPQMFSWNSFTTPVEFSEKFLCTRVHVLAATPARNSVNGVSDHRVAVSVARQGSERKCLEVQAVLTVIHLNTKGNTKQLCCSNHYSLYATTQMLFVFVFVALKRWKCLITVHLFLQR